MKPRPGKAILFVPLTAMLFAVTPAAGEEFHLKDGTKLVGKIVAYENDAFRVETSFGIAIIYKDRIVRIVFPESTAKTPTTEKAPQTTTKKATPVAKEPVKHEDKPEVEPSTKEDKKSDQQEARGEIAPAPSVAPQKLAEERTRPEAAREKATTSVKKARRRVPPPTPRPPEKIIEQVSGTRYVNKTYRFRMFKPPTWRSYPQLVKPQTPLVAALGTPDESTLLLIGREAYDGDLREYVRLAERSLEQIYENYRRQGERPIQVAGLPAVERSFTGMAEGRFWTGLAVYFVRDQHYYTLLGLTAAGETTSFQQAVLRKVVHTLEFLPE